jgi:phytoene synthase
MPRPKTLEEPYRSRAVPSGTARYWSWLFATRECRDALLGVYALLAEWRLLMDPATEAGVAQLKIAWWQDEIRRLMAGAPVHPISRHLAALPRAASTDFTPLLDAVAAAAQEVAGVPLEHRGQLERHAAALGAGPLMVAARLSDPAPAPAPGGPRAALADCLAALATAGYLAQALTDYQRETRAGRVSFPIDELLAAGIETADLLAAGPPPALASYLDSKRLQALESYRHAAAALEGAERARLRHLPVLAALGIKHLNTPTPAAAARFRFHDLYLAWTTARRAALT